MQSQNQRKPAMQADKNAVASQSKSLAANGGAVAGSMTAADRVMKHIKAQNKFSSGSIPNSIGMAHELGKNHNTAGFEASNSNAGGIGRGLSMGQVGQNGQPAHGHARRNLQQMAQQKDLAIGGQNGNAQSNGTFFIANSQGQHGNASNHGHSQSVGRHRPTNQPANVGGVRSSSIQPNSGPGMGKNAKQFGMNGIGVQPQGASLHQQHSASFSGVNAVGGSTPAITEQMQAQHSQQIKRIRESRQRGVKQVPGAQTGSQGVADQNQMLYAYTNQTHTFNSKADPSGAIGGQHSLKTTEPGRIRAHSDMKKANQLNLVAKGNSSMLAQERIAMNAQHLREQHNNTTGVLAGGSGNNQSNNFVSGMQNFQNRGGSVSGSGLSIHVQGQTQKRSQSVDRNAPHISYNSHHAGGFPSTTQYKSSGAHGKSLSNSSGLMLPDHNQQYTQNQGAGANTSTAASLKTNSNNNAHFIHEAIERKIERFSRQRNRGAMTVGSTNAAQQVYSQHLTNTYGAGNNNQGGTPQQIANGGQGSRGFKAQQKLNANQSTGSNADGSMMINNSSANQQESKQSVVNVFERRKKTNNTAPSIQTSVNNSVVGQSSHNPQGVILQRGEIMSAGQPSMAQRKNQGNGTVGQNQLIGQSHFQMHHQHAGNGQSSAVAANHDEDMRNIYQMLDNYAPNKQKSNRGGSRGVGPSTHGLQNNFTQNQMQSGITNNSGGNSTGGATGAGHGPTGPLLSNKVVVQLPNKKTHQNAQGIRSGKIKLDKLGKMGQQQMSSQFTDGQNSNQVQGIVTSPGQKSMHMPSGNSPNSPNKLKNKLTIIEVDQQRQTAQDNNQIQQTTRSAASPQGQGVQGQQLLQEPKKKRNPKIAVISMTTGPMSVSGKKQQQKSSMIEDDDSDGMHVEEGPDERAQPQISASQKRLSQKQIGMSHSHAHSPDRDSRGSLPNRHGNDYSDLTGSGARTVKHRSKKKYDQHLGTHDTNSKGSVTVSMRDESIMHMSVNSVTDEKFHKRHDDEQSNDSNNHHSIKKQMIRYLSRVADRQKPLFVFNQKINLGGDSSDDSDTGTPSFSLVALIEQ